ncbi:GNAT family N-acetyltransferase [Cytobacillus sp. FJAT-54145]|uniref:GNAT family N-acetyltransferase n=1 Tax=Cytobacillus spartinae TaxID=3299023 RepID=A0ABW6K5I7_9BACI
MERKIMLNIFTKELRKDIHYPGWKREETPYTVRHISEHNEHGFVLFSNLNKQNIHSVIQDELNFFNSINQPFEWKVFDYDQPENLIEALTEYGFEVENKEALMVLDIEESTELLSYEFSPNIFQITDEKGIRDLMELEGKIWKTDHQELGDRLIRDLKANDGNLYIYASYVDGKAVSGAWMYLERGTSFGSLWGGSTLPEFRGKGLYTSLIAIRAQKARELGYRFLTVDASPMSQPILENKGFKCLAYSTPCQSPK